MSDQRLTIEFVVGDGEAHARVTDGLSGGDFELEDASLEIENLEELDTSSGARWGRFTPTGERVITIRGKVKR